MDQKTPASSPTTAITPNGLSAKTARSISRTTERTVRMDPLRTALTPEKTVVGSAMLTTRSIKEMGSASPGQAIEMTSESQSVGKETRRALKAGGVFGRSKDLLKDGSLRMSEVAGKNPESQTTPSRLSYRTAKSNKKTPQKVKNLITGSALKTQKIPKTGEMATAFTPTSVKTAKSIKSQQSGGSTKTARLSFQKTSVRRAPMKTAMGAFQNTPIVDAYVTAKSQKRVKKTADLGSSSSSSVKSGKSVPKTPMNTAITPNGLSCNTAKTIKTEQTPTRPGLRPSARRSLFPNLKIKDLKSSSKKSTKSVKFSDQRQQKKKRKMKNVQKSGNSARSNLSANSSKSRNSVADSFTGTPKTCHSIPPHVLADAKAEQNKIVLTSSTDDGSFRVVVQLKMKLVSAASDPQALMTRMIVVNGQERYNNA